MSGSNTPCLIAVDGGGTRCRMALVVGNRRVDHSTDRANVHTDPDGAVATLVAGLEALAQKADLPRDALAQCCGYFGLAGVKGPDGAARVACRLPLRRVRVEDDPFAAVRGALGPADGVVAGIGTGSFFATKVAGRVTLRGGWGFVLGDEASGGWLGRHLLARVLHVRDGLCARSDLTDGIWARFGTDPEALVDFAGSARPADFAAFAPDIADAADCGDPNGLALMDEGAAHIARALAALDWPREAPLCLVGGLAVRYAAYLPVELAARVRPAKASALEGALQLAADLAEAPTP